MSENLNITAQRIKEMREKKKITKTALADKLSTTRFTIADMENGNKRIYTEELNLLCDIFGCDSDYLLGRIDTPTHEASDICGKTGLTPKAAEILSILKQAKPEPGVISDRPEHCKRIIDTINTLIEFTANESVIYSDNLIVSFFYLISEYIGMTDVPTIDGNPIATIDSGDSSYSFTVRELFQTRLTKNIINWLDIIYDDKKRKSISSQSATAADNNKKKGSKKT